MPFTVNKNLNQMINGSNVGVWDGPTNSNWGIVDTSLGGTAVVPVAGSNVVLSPTQYQSVFINFTGALSASITVTFPAILSGFYTVQNLTSNSSAFGITLNTTAAGGQAIGMSPGEPVDIFSDGTNIKYRDLGRIGTYWDYAGSSVPAWVVNCTVPPYLNCDGTAFSSATYPILATILGTNTLPDSRGRFRAALNAGTARLTAANSINGDVRFSGGGNELLMAHRHAASIYDAGHTHSVSITTIPGNSFVSIGSGANGTTAPGNNVAYGVAAQADNAGTGVRGWDGGSFDTTYLAGSGGSQNVPPGYIGGITLIRAA